MTAAFNIPSSLSSSIETITPAQAQAMLNNNHKNRHISRNHVNALARDIEAGAWELTGEPIVLGPTGELLDGQHRLSACIQAGVAIQVLVVRGVKSFEKGDAGRKRQAGDVLAMNGVRNATAVAASSARLIAVSQGLWTTVCSRSEILAFADRHPALSDVTGKISGQVKYGLATAVSVAAYIGVYHGRADDAAAFVEVFKTGVPGYRHCPAHLVRERVIRDRGTPRQPSSTVVASLVLSAWVKFSKHEEARQMKPMSPIKVPGWSRREASSSGPEWDAAEWDASGPAAP